MSITTVLYQFYKTRIFGLSDCIGESSAGALLDFNLG